PQKLPRGTTDAAARTAEGDAAGDSALMMPVVLLGGIYSGITTPTEAAAVAAAYALVISVLLYRSVSFAEFYRSVLASARTTASIGMLIAGALVFNYVVTIENIPHS